MSRPEFVVPRPNLKYRVYYNNETGKCITKTTEILNIPHPFILVNLETYKIIDNCDRFVVNNGVITRTKFIERVKKLRKRESGRYITTKNNMIFLVTDESSTDIDKWDIVSDD